MSDNDSFPIKCLFCSRSIKTKKDFKVHLDEHTELSVKDRMSYLKGSFREKSSLKKKGNQFKKISVKKQPKKFRLVKLTDETFEKFKDLHLKRIIDSKFPEGYIKKVEKTKTASELKELIKENSTIGLQQKDYKGSLPMIYIPTGGQNKFMRK